MTLKIRRLLHLIVFVLLGLLVRTAIVDVYFANKSDKLRSLLTSDDLLFDHIPLANVNLLARALNETVPTDPYFVHSFFAVHYLIRHIFPPLYVAVLYSFLHFFPHFCFPEEIMILARDEFNLNVLAGALYGAILGTAVCCTLTGIACTVAYSLVSCIRCLCRPLLSNTVWSQKIAIYNELVDIEEELNLLSEQLATTRTTAAKDALKERQDQLKRHRLETILKGLRLQEAEFKNGDMQECSLVERYLFGTSDEEVNEIFLDILVDRAFQSSSYASLLYATVHYPQLVTTLAYSIGYFPYAAYGAAKGAKMMEANADSLDKLIEDQSPRLRFHLGVFFFILWLTPFLVQMAILKREQFINNVFLNRWHIRSVRRALDEEEMAVAANDQLNDPLNEQLDQLDQENMEIDPNFLLL